MSGSGSGGGKGTTFSCDVSDLHAGQRSRSEVITTPYHIRLDFRLKQHPYHNGFIVISIISTLSLKHKIYKYSV